MNYRHAFHAGNFADVLKHMTFCRVLVHLRQKPAAFRVIDTHAGAGLYDLAGDEASRGGEWRDGIARLREADFAPKVESLLAPYLDTVAAFNPPGKLVRYPGSPLIAQAWLRPQDRLVACELEPGAGSTLARSLDGDPRCRAMSLDGWTALRAQLPPKERRGVVLIDPPFERADEFTVLLHAVTAAYRKWPSGIFLLWHPIKERRDADRLTKGMEQFGADKLLRIELSTAAGRAEKLSRCGLIAINPPWTLEPELTLLLPALAQCFSGSRRGAFRLDRLTREI